MALRKTIQLDNGLQVDCYCRIGMVQLSKGTGFSIGVFCYAWQGDAEEQGTFDAVHHNNYHFPFDPDPQPQVSNVITRGYAMLKSLPEFADAVDC